MPDAQEQHVAPDFDPTRRRTASEKKRTFFSTTLRPGESPFQLAAEFVGIGVFGVVFLAIGLIPLADNRALGNAALSYAVGAATCLMATGLMIVSVRGVWRVLVQVRRSRRVRRDSSARSTQEPKSDGVVETVPEMPPQIPRNDSQ